MSIAPNDGFISYLFEVQTTIIAIATMNIEYTHLIVRFIRAFVPIHSFGWNLHKFIWKHKRLKWIKRAEKRPKYPGSDWAGEYFPWHVTSTNSRKNETRDFQINSLFRFRFPWNCIAIDIEMLLYTLWFKFSGRWNQFSSLIGSRDRRNTDLNF